MDIDRLTRVERETLRAAAARALVECCDECRDLLPAQLQADVNGGRKVTPVVVDLDVDAGPAKPVRARAHRA